MKPNEIVTVYVAFTDKNDGKRRPILVVSDKEDRVEFFGITSQYEKKSDRIKRVYFPISEWEKAGLKKQSWIDVGSLKAIPKSRENISFKKVGMLSASDTKKLNRFIERLQRKV
ncbi:type II toxin-antitoxin system PemK/MazF family toxin [Enterococcus faecalis]|uniref:type II toxin-antitoxin system PemK/MazF family toxin n=1 Tax=Enterococcus faecalis TaxID=1351 RepID=UPI001E656D9E|nr:type II toxin-antitoxin system PemK/MazF family toxin [Enterococcus faecalis]HAQ6469939.1 type II toxin-antitoxin system PemK/MazF family toxin [Enterococcus faecium]MCE2569529.1 type II toxin-antitoxin system PemK/MazF family toxin [Enterococcus faecalis]HAQ6565153.1 type II toxin-antitoxin system PemK/MazF family toxin [Enterococcus faecium]HAQ7601512.1 type II toxin-antitoxin system PemK/MazF family toxin [Enterococcus faecium]HAZ1124948.1 type II toxin-antitoxin system PemK/MazF family 